MSHVLSSPPPMVFPRPGMDRSMSYQTSHNPRMMSPYSTVDSNLSSAALPRIPRSTSKSRIHSFASPTPSPPAVVEAVAPVLDTRNVKSGSNTLPRPKKSRGYVFPLVRDEEDESEHSGAEKAPPAPPPTPTPAPSIAHKAYTPGKGNALRLNLDSIRRTASEIGVPTANFLASTSSAAPLPSSSAPARKKSGELVRPSLKSHSNLTIMTSSPGGTYKPSKSCPTTPTAKNVHFDAKLEHVKLFLAEQKPLAVSRDGSPTETSEGEEFPFPYASSDDEKIRKALSIKLIGFPVGPRKVQEVQLESLTLSEDARSLNGIVLVRNLAFHKWIAARFTLDSWQTVSEVMARHLESVRGGLYDRFIFTVKLVDVLPRIAEKTMQVAVRYSIEGAEMWDNNDGKNYHVQFSKAAKSENRQAKTSTNAAGDQIAALRRELEKVVNKGDDSESDSAAAVLLRVGKRSGSGSSPTSREFGSQASLPSSSAPTLSISTSSTRLGATPQPKRSSPQSESPPPSPLKSPEALSARYDFRASLKNTWVPPPLPLVAPLLPSTIPQSQVLARPPAPYRENSIPTPPSSRGSPPGALASDANAAVLGAAPLPRGSPRDRDHSCAGSDSEVGPDGTSSSAAGRKSWSPIAAAGGGRNHRRTSYFDQWITLTPNVRKAPPGSPINTRFAAPRGMSASVSSPTSTSSNETVTPGPGTTTPIIPEIYATAASPEPRQNGSSNYSWGISLHSPNWSVSESISSVSSSPSLSSGSPSSPPNGLGELEPSPFSAGFGGTTPKAGEGFSYHSFLDRFCFYTGPGATLPPPAVGAPETERLDPRRTHSASSVEGYFLAHEHTHTRTASNTSNGGVGAGSGHSTPTNKTTPKSAK